VIKAQKKQIEDVLRCIPGYDPFAAPGDSCLDHDAALRAINFFAEHMKHIEGSARGTSFILSKWQAAIVGNLFGWKRTDDAGRRIRRYRKSLIFIARGNGKTPLAAGIVLYAFYEDREPGAQCFLAAGQREQAGILFRNAAGFVDQDTGLTARSSIYRGDQHRSIVLKSDPLSFCKTIPADAAGQHGGIPHITVVDELHVQDNRELLDVFETAMSKKVRSQPLLVMITTSDYERPSVCNEVYDYAVKVRDGVIDDPTFLPVIYELKEDEDWRDESNWGKANPNLDVSVSRESLRLAVKKAQNDPGFENELRRLHFNQRTKTDRKVISMPSWDACKSARGDDHLLGRMCYGGLDMASRGDLASFSLLFPGDIPELRVWSWCPQAKIDWRLTRKIPYDVWAREGWIKATSGDRIDHREIRKTICELGQKFDIREICYDPKEATTITSDLQDADGFKLVEVTQTIHNFSVPTKEFISLVHSEKILHDGNPVLRWAVSNLALYYKGVIPQGESILEFLDKVPVMPSKLASADKIDPVTAAILSLLGMMRNPSALDNLLEVRAI
jgi:phage terminase large subunit-like protein